VRRVVTLWGPVLVWCAVIFWFSSRASLDLQHAYPDWPDAFLWDYPLRKLAHLSEYAVLFLLVRRGASAPKAWFFCLFYAVTDEWHQSFVPGRDGRATDVAIDSCAAALAWLATRVKPLLRPK
jgi:VanZ family protein